MTLAVCVQCGESKVGAFVPCPRCGLDPAARGTDRELQAKALLLTDRFLSPDVLRAAARKLQAGEPVAYDAGLLAQAVEELRTQKLPVLSKAPLGFAISAWGLVGLMLAVIAALGLMFWAGRS